MFSVSFSVSVAPKAGIRGMLEEDRRGVSGGSYRTAEAAEKNEAAESTVSGLCVFQRLQRFQKRVSEEC